MTLAGSGHLHVARDGGQCFTRFTTMLDTDTAFIQDQGDGKDQLTQ